MKGTGDIMTTYTTRFELNDEVHDFKQAQNYLNQHDMTEFLLTDKRCICPDAIISIMWMLNTKIDGSVMLRTKRELTREELDSISEWIREQNSDGVGEDFLQQDFAQYPYTREELDSISEWINDDFSDLCHYAYFDWETNEYRLEKVI